MKKIIYGPVPSWRLGRSLGLDMISQPGKTCSFDCCYCQLGKTVYPTKMRGEFVSLARLQKELSALPPVALDYATFSGTGEPTLAVNLKEAIILARTTLKKPVAVLTNASLISNAPVRAALAEADKVVAKLDAPTEELFQNINRPVVGISLAEVVRGLRLFRKEYSGRLALQIMFVKENQTAAKALAELAEEIKPEEVELNTPLRPCLIPPLSKEVLTEIKQAFANLNALSVYDEAVPEVTPLDREATKLRRPIERREGPSL